ncbi:MAG: TonB-dependent receptor [Gammaproteobacteria bacterium]|nr:TonB-dependent receptor [Gammaproteobacteria bacterium]
MNSRLIARLLPFFIAAAINPLPVAAQLEEIVVTAQKRAESLQDVPIAVQAFTGENLDELGVQSAEDIMLYVPNAAILPQGGTKMNYFIRGVGTADFHLNVVGAVGVYLDDVALNSPFAVTFNTFDMERVEVLRGPQNTLFGRNTTGGAVNYISRKPDVDDGLNGYLEAGYGRYDQFDIEAGGGVALGENAAARIAFSSNMRDGAWRNHTLDKDIGNYQRQALRGQLRVQPDASLDLLFNVHGGVSRSNPDPYKNIGLQDPTNRAAPCPLPAGALVAQNNPNCIDSTGFSHQYQNWEDNFGNLEMKENVDLWGTSFRAEWDLDAFTVVSVTAYEEFEVEFAEDSDGSPNTGFQFYQDGEYEQWSQELRLQSAAEGSLRWIAGFYWFLEDGEYATAVRRTPAPLAPAGPRNFNIIPNTIVTQDNEVYSVYGQVEYDMQSDLTATVGLRWTKETKEGVNNPSVRCVGTGGPPFCPPASNDFHPSLNTLPDLPGVFFPPAEDLDYDSTDWGARFALDWQASDDVLLYGSISRGFKGGGFSLAALQALTGNAAESVAPEILWAYEVGVKTAWLDNSLQLNGAIFYYDWADLHSFQPLVDPTSGEAIPRLLNVPEASLKGGEVELQWVPEGGWLLIAGVGLLDGQIDDPGEILGVFKGNNLPNTADLTFNGLARKEFAVSGGMFSIQANWWYKDEVTYDLANAPNLSQPEGVWNLDARAAFRFGPGERYEVAAWGKNLNGAEYCRGATSLQGLVESNICLGNLSEPTYGVTAAIRFE